MDKAAQLEQELLIVEKESIENWGKKREENNNVKKHVIDIGSIKEHVDVDRWHHFLQLSKIKHLKKIVYNCYEPC